MRRAVTKKVDIGYAVLPAWLSSLLPAAFSGSPLQGHGRVSHADGLSVVKVRCWTDNKKVATKQTGHAFAFSEGLSQSVM